ncbi:MAG TPA: DUF1572 family protein [Thermoanaerobaculia bacterium]|nr:DUF1572 family protein [Thermoanaerobaculia bacterium]
MTPVIGDFYLEDARRQFHGQKKLAEKAIAQVSEAEFFEKLDPEANSIALVVKHIAGNLRSRWLDFFTSDGEKPDRHRDTEFEETPADTRAALLERWEASWKILFDVIDPMKPADLERTVTIRGEPHTVVKAVNRQLTHYAYHVGQIVFLAKHFAGGHWESLSIPRGKSEDFNDRMRAKS